jgi:predicted transcriptional regulator
MIITNGHGQENEFSVLLSLSRGAESRRKILKALLSNSKNCSQIAREVKLNWRTVNRHLQILIKENMVKKLDFGERKYYKMTSKGQEVIRDIIQTKNGLDLKKTNE